MIHAAVRGRRRAPFHVTARRGISLLEVIIAMVILLTSVMMLSRLAFLARQHAIGGEDRSKAQMLCSNLLSEMLCGSTPLQNVPPQVFEGDLWMYSVDVEQVATMPLAKVTVKVYRLDENTEAVSTSVPDQDAIPTFQLVSWLRAANMSFDSASDAAAGMMAEPDTLDPGP
jgi:Tfp pilus assembly protein PilV